MSTFFLPPFFLVRCALTERYRMLWSFWLKLFLCINSYPHSRLGKRMQITSIHFLSSFFSNHSTNDDQIWLTEIRSLIHFSSLDLFPWVCIVTAWNTIWSVARLLLTPLKPSFLLVFFFFHLIRDKWPCCKILRKWVIKENRIEMFGNVASMPWWGNSGQVWRKLFLSLIK